MGGVVKPVLAPVISIGESLGVISKAPTQAQSSAPPAPVVSQATATTATAQNTVRRGKSPAILTSPYGVDPNATLGKPTLLGS
jgi:hypothetical protein